jgi:hypothetical protein
LFQIGAKTQLHAPGNTTFSWGCTSNPVRTGGKVIGEDRVGRENRRKWNGFQPLSPKFWQYACKASDSELIVKQDFLVGSTYLINKAYRNLHLPESTL